MKITDAHMLYKSAGIKITKKGSLKTKWIRDVEESNIQEAFLTWRLLQVLVPRFAYTDQIHLQYF